MDMDDLEKLWGIDDISNSGLADSNNDDNDGLKDGDDDDDERPN